MEKQRFRATYPLQTNLTNTTQLLDDVMSTKARRGGDLIINLAALADNYHFLTKKVKPALCSAVVKADAYGLGASAVAHHLLGQGCRHFFVAHLQEALNLRALIKDTALSDKVVIYVLHGLEKDAEDYYDEFDLVPICGTLADCHAWLYYAQRQGKKLPFGLQFDTGMHRLGLSDSGFESWPDKDLLLQVCDLQLVMSHLACSDEPRHKMNVKQLDQFKAIRKKFSTIPASLANSGGIFLGEDYHFNLVRPGAALYGLNPHPSFPNPMKPVIELYTTIKHVHESPKGDTVGYGATYTCPLPRRLATVAMGYADGFFRRLGGTHEQPQGFGFWQGQPVPLVGRVSMDLMVFDITECKEPYPQVGDKIELIGPHQTIDDLALKADTIGYEIITNMKAHHQRTYRL